MLRIGVLSAKNGGRRPPMLSPQAGRGGACGSTTTQNMPPRNFQISTELHPEDLRVARLDLLTHALDAGGIVLPQLDLVEPARPRLLFGEGVDRMLTGEIDQELLRLERMQPVLAQARGVRIGRRLEARARPGDQ